MKDRADDQSQDVLAENGLSDTTQSVPAGAQAPKTEPSFDSGDSVNGLGKGADMLDGGPGSDIIYGDFHFPAGSAPIVTGTGNDILHGQSGNDILYGHAGNDRLYGGTGNDAPYGGLGWDWLFGQAGNDLLLGNFRWDVFNGGAGTDRYVVRWP
ncbi:calcium-binding protein [Thermodesulfobacteriota bacterium]